MTRSDQPRLFPDQPGRPPRGRARRGFDQTIVAMRATGRLEPVDAALIALCRVTVDELDQALVDRDESRYVRGVLVARYHDVLTHLLARPDDVDDASAELAALFGEVGDPAEPVTPD